MNLATYIGRKVRVYWNKDSNSVTVVDPKSSRRVGDASIVVLTEVSISPKQKRARHAYVTGTLHDVGEDSRDSIPRDVLRVPCEAVTEQLTADTAYVHNGRVTLDWSIDD